MFTIYCHTHRESGRRYIGQTKKTVLQRWSQHVYTSTKLVKKGWSHFANAIRVHGRGAFDHEILETCETIEESNAAERKWIAHFDTTNPEKGFNVKKGGDHVPHPVRNPWDRPGFRERQQMAYQEAISKPEYRVGLSRRTVELWQDPEFRERVVSASKAARATPESRARHSAAQKAIKARPDVKARASVASREMWDNPEFRARNAVLWDDPSFRGRCESGLRRGASLNAAKTHCKSGHPLSGENLYVNKRGSRECRTCSRERGRMNVRAARARARSVSTSYRPDVT